MKKPWSKHVEQIVFSTLESKTRVLGVTSPSGEDNVADLSIAMAGTLASAGSRTILVDLSQPIRESVVPPPWLPGDGGIGQSVRPSAHGYDVLQAAPTPDTRLLFSNAELYRRTFAEELRHYTSIVIEMPPVLNGVLEQVNPIGPALACESVMMMCTAGHTAKEQLQAALAPLRSAGIALSGVVMDESASPTLAEELAREARRLRAISPALADWLERKLLSWTLLQGR